MGDQEELTQLIAAAYDAALDTSLWISVLAGIADFVGGRAAVLVADEGVRPHRNAYYHVGVDAAYARLYARSYSRLDPFKAGPSFPVGHIVSMTDLVSYDELRRSRFYQEWARPQGFIDAAHAVLEKSPTTSAFLRVIRGVGDGLVDDDMRRRLSLVAEHVRRAVRIGRALEIKQAEAAEFASTLDCLRPGLFLVAADGKIVHANAAGHALLAADEIVRSIRGRMVLGDAQIDQRLRETLAAAEKRNVAADISDIALPLASRGGERYVVRALGLRARRPRRAGHVRIAVFVHKVALELPSHPEVIAAAYGLTPGELRALLALVEVGGVPEVADALGIAASTAKTHVGRLFEKTGTRRQADLVKLVAAFSNPLASTACGNGRRSENPRSGGGNSG